MSYLFSLRSQCCANVVFNLSVTHLETLKKQLTRTKSEEQREKIKKAITLIKQRQATEKDVNLKRRVKHDLLKQQIDNLKAGKRASFITRGESNCFLS